MLLTEHVFDKLWALDLTLSEFRALLESEAEVIEETVLGEQQLKELLLYIDWRCPLHVVVVVDDAHHEERVITVYEPEPGLWSDDWRRRR